MALVGFAGSRELPVKHRSLVRQVVDTIVATKRGIAVGCATGADAMALRACFTEDWALRAQQVHVFAAFGRNGDGSWRNSAVKLVHKVSKHSAAKRSQRSKRWIKVSWWAGGDSNVELIPRLKNRTTAMVSALVTSGKGRGLVAFVAGGVKASPGTWSTVYQAHKRGVPVVVFSCGCPVEDFLPLGQGQWVPAGKGIWAQGWRWEPAL